MEAEAPGLFFTIIAFLVALSVLVFVHEWGHYIVARWCGVRVQVFSIGFGPEIYGWDDKHGTRWKISWLPLGGYVKFFGDAGAASNPSDTVDQMTPEERAVSFHHKSVGKRAAIVAAGPLVNFLFAILIFAGFFFLYGKPYAPAIVAEVTEGSAAEQAGFLPEDRILSFNGRSVRSFDELAREIQIHPGIAVTIEVDRDGIVVPLEAVPNVREQEDRFGNRYRIGFLGISRQVGGEEVLEFGPGGALVEAVRETARLTRMMLVTTGQIIMGVRSIDDLGGPIRIAKVSGEQAALGIAAFIGFMALISINLGLVNLFPIPMLDGGHLMFYAIEALKGEPLSVRAQEFGYMVGLAFVVGLMILLTWNDLNSL